MELDEIDRAILGLLQHDARSTQREIGRQVGLSPNAAGARVQRLVERGVIRAFRAEIDHAALGRSIEASVDLWMAEDRDRDGLFRVVRDDDRIVECFHPTGPLDFRIRVRVASPEDLSDLLTRLRIEGGVRQTDSRLVLDRIETRPEPPTRRSPLPGTPTDE